MTFWPLVFIFFIGHGGGGSVVVPEVVLDADGDVVVVLGVVDVVVGLFTSKLKIYNNFIWKGELTFTALHVTVAPGLPVSSLSDSSGAPDKIFHQHQK